MEDDFVKVVEGMIEEIFELDSFKELNEYRKSEENLKRCQPFEDLNEKYILLQEKYANSFDDLHKDIEIRTHRREYSKGGTTLHRGFYSPSLTDLVTIGSSRGKLLKRPPKESNFNYEYLFDEQNNLLCVYKYYDDYERNVPHETELFVRLDNKVLGLEFNSVRGLNVISECRYENKKLANYEMALCELHSLGKAGCTQIEVETREYKNDLLQVFCWYRYSPSIRLLTNEKYTFLRDEEGNLSAFTINDLGGYRPEGSCDDQTEYPLTKKAKTEFLEYSKYVGGNKV